MTYQSGKRMSCLPGFRRLPSAYEGAGNDICRPHTPMGNILRTTKHTTIHTTDELAEKRALMVIDMKEILHEKELQKLRKQHTDTLSSLQSRNDTLAKEYRSLESTTARRQSRVFRR